MASEDDKTRKTDKWDVTWALKLLCCFCWETLVSVCPSSAALAPPKGFHPLSGSADAVSNDLSSHYLRAPLVSSSSANFGKVTK